MKGSADQLRMAKALSFVGRAVSSRSTLPVLANILIEFKDGVCRFAATNREVGIICWIQAEIEEDGAITIPARLLTEFINSLPPEKVEMKLNSKTQTLNMRCDKFESNIKGIDANEFPIIGSKTPDDVVGLQIQSSGLRKTIDQVVFAASTDDNRPTLTGVEFNVSEVEGQKLLRLAATDGYRLSVRKFPLEDATVNDISVIVPARSLGELARISVDAEDESLITVFFTPERNQVIFNVLGDQGKKDGFVGVQVVSELIDAKFPDWSATVPKFCSTDVDVYTDDLLKAAKVGLLFARDNANIIRLSASTDDSGTGILSVSATSAEMGDNTSELSATINGEDVSIAFDAKLMIDYLSKVNSKSLTIELTQPTRPAMFYAAGCKDEHFHVLMPMHPPRQ